MRGPETRRWRIGSAAAVLGAAAILAAGARAATGDLAYQDCISGETESAPACVLSPTADTSGTDTGFDGLDRVVVGADGADVYGLSRSNDAIVHLRRDPATGALTYADCVTGDNAITACTAIPGASTMGDSGFELPVDLALSADGGSLYAVSGADTAVARFNRDPATGVLSFADCISGETQTTGQCTLIPLATPMGNNSGFDQPEALVVSPDGRNLYVLSYGDHGVATFGIGADGSLAYRGCVTAEALVASCTQLPGATMDGTGSGFASLQSVAVTADGRSLYTVDDADESIAHFDRDRKTGALSFVNCLTAETNVTNCDAVPGATPTGAGTGIRSLVDVSTSPDLSSVYAVGDSEYSLIHYSRDPASGALSFAGCLTGSNAGADLCTAIPTASPGGMHSGMEGVDGAAVGPDGRSVDVVAGGDDGVAHFVRDPRSGALTYAGCIGAEVASAAACAQIPSAASGGTNTGLDATQSPVVSPDGISVYVVAFGDDAVARFDREPDADGPRLKLKADRRQDVRAPALGAGAAKAGKVVIKAICKDEFCSKVTLRGAVAADGRRAKLKKAKATAVQADDAERIALKLSGKAKRLVRDVGEARLTVKAKARDLLGNSTGKRKRLVLEG